VIEPPARTLAGPVLTTDRSAEAPTCVGAEALLSVRSGSAVAEVTAAVFESDAAAAGAVTTTVITGAVAPAARLGSEQDTDVLPMWVQVQPAPSTDTNVTPAGSVSVTSRASAADGPALDTVSE
jgi:hypothetical protein